MPTRFSYIFGITTEADDRESASPHSGGWSESWWQPADAGFEDWVVRLGTLRATILPKQAAIVGIRRALYTIAGNKLIPRGTSSMKILLPGNPARECDLPQVALQCAFTGPLGNTSRATLRGMPDDVMSKGEYRPNADMKGRVTRFLNEIVSQTWGFIGRDLSKPVAKITSISSLGVAKLEGNIGAQVNDFVRLLNVRDDTGTAVTGVFQVTATDLGGAQLTLANWPAGVVVMGSGGMRVDAAAFVNINGAEVSRAVVRKIGAPFEKYRGRASKKSR